MKLSTIVLAVLIVIAIVPAVSALDLKFGAVDRDTGTLIQKSTVCYKNQCQSNVGVAIFPNVDVGSRFEMKATAAGYGEQEPESYIDPALTSCSGSSCSFISGSDKNVYKTSCNLNTQYNDYDCKVENNGFTNLYVFNKAKKTVAITAFMVPATPPTKPPVVTISPSTSSGTAPLKVSFVITATDSDGTIQHVTFRFGDQESFVDDGLSTASYSKSFDHIYLNKGIYEGSMHVIDNSQAVTEKTFTITVGTPTPNNPPTANAGAKQTVKVGAAVTLDGSGSSDPDGDSLEYLWKQTKGDTVTIVNPTKEKASIIPQKADTLEFQLAVSDGKKGDVDTVEIVVEAATGNQAPVVDVGGPYTVEAGKLLAFIVKATDADGDSLAYSADNLPQGAAFDGNTQKFTWTPTSNQIVNTPYKPRFSVTDGTNSVTEEAQITVKQSTTNLPPKISVPVTTLSLQVGETKTIQATATDADNGQLTFSVSGQPSQSSINAQTGLFTVTGAQADIANSPLTTIFKVEDGQGGEATATVSITVSGTSNPGDNKAPTADAGVDQTIPFGQDLILDGSRSTDSDGSIVTYRWTATTFDRSSTGSTLRIIEVGPVSSDLPIGTHTITLTVTDDDGAVNADQVVIEVLPEPLRDQERFRTEREKLYIDGIRFNDFGQAIQPGRPLLTSVRLENNAGKDLRDVSVTVLIPELGLRRRAGPFEIENNEEVTRSVPIVIPQTTTPGTYLVRIVSSSDDVRRTDARYIRIG